MKVAVVGGSGTLGAPLVAELAAQEDEVWVLSRGSTPLALPPGVSHRPIDLTSGEGLDEALAGVEVVIDTANSQKQAQEVLVEGTRRLAEAGARADVRHH